MNDLSKFIDQIEHIKNITDSATVSITRLDNVWQVDLRENDSLKMHSSSDTILSIAIEGAVTKYKFHYQALAERSSKVVNSYTDKVQRASRMNV